MTRSPRWNFPHGKIDQAPRKRFYLFLAPVWLLLGIFLAMSVASIWDGRMLVGTIGVLIVLFIAGVLTFVLLPVFRDIFR